MQHTRQVIGRAALPAPRAAAVAAGTLAALLAAASTGGEVTMYDAAPTAGEIVAVLLGGKPEGERGGRSRSIRMKPEADSNPGSGVLGFAVRFALDSDRINPMDHPFLDELAGVMHLPEMERNSLVVEGHTDARGTDSYNDALSLRRANSVIAYLVERHGIASARLIPAGRGEREPLDPTDPTDDANRRVQFYLPGAK